MRLAWARKQRAEGRDAWLTPSIHTWDAWLTRQWREAVQRGAIAPAQLLGASQERVLWEQHLARSCAAGDDESMQTVHAGALMAAAARATQSRLALAPAVQTREERLLVETLASVRADCSARGLVSLRLAPAEALGFLAGVAAPLFVGVAQLDAQQALLGARYWPGHDLLLALPAAHPVHTQFIRAGDVWQELAACAAWCRRQLARDPAARLLVLTAAREPSTRIQAQQLWQRVAAGAATDATLRQRWLAEEEGEPLPHLGLVADALLALGLQQEEGVEISAVLQLLRSPHLSLGSRAQCCALAAWLEAAGLAWMSHAALRQALLLAAAEHPAATRLATWLEALGRTAGGPERLGTTEWATRFASVLAEGGFAAAQHLDARGQQVLVRWHELLDEFAALDAVLAPMSCREAVERLQRLASQARHLPPLADAAIGFSDRLTDPVANYDGIWVLGVAESSWPAAPRPDAWVPLAEQRRAGWSEASAGGRRLHAQWALECWQRRTSQLVLSYAAQDGDVHHRPTGLVAPDSWIDAGPESIADTAIGQAARSTDQQLAAFAADELGAPLRGGALRLDTQQACAFRAQARWRLGAEPPAGLHAGIPALLRGRLLHALLEHLWQQLQDQAALLALDPAAQARLLEASWHAALRATREAAWLSAHVLERERGRTLRLMAQVLELERQRAPFAVRHRERAGQWQGAGARLALRIDRIDETAGQAILLDYKSGSPPGIRLQRGELQPLQLALYADTLAQQGQSVAAAVLLNLHPAKASFTGVVAHDGLLPGRLHAVGELGLIAQAWHEELQRLMSAHLAGEATLARHRQACLHCHLPALCRRAEADAADDAAAENADG